MPNPHVKTAKAFNALAHPRRITLFKLINEAKIIRCTFGRLQAQTKFTPAVLSHHLRVMEEGGLIKRRQAGSFTEFSTTTGKFNNAIAPMVRDLTPAFRLAA